MSLFFPSVCPLWAFLPMLLVLDVCIVQRFSFFAVLLMVPSDPFAALCELGNSDSFVVFPPFFHFALSAKAAFTIPSLYYFALVFFHLFYGLWWYSTSKISPPCRCDVWWGAGMGGVKCGVGTGTALERGGHRSPGYLEPLRFRIWICSPPPNGIWIWTFTLSTVYSLYYTYTYTVPTPVLWYKVYLHGTPSASLYDVCSRDQAFTSTRLNFCLKGAGGQLNFFTGIT